MAIKTLIRRQTDHRRDTAQVGPGVAKRLNILQLTYVSKIESCDPEKREIILERRAEGGVQVLKTKLPCLITMLEGSNEVRRGTIDDSLRAAPRRSSLEREGRRNRRLTKVRPQGLADIVKKVFAPTRARTAPS